MMKNVEWMIKITSGLYFLFIITLLCVQGALAEDRGLWQEQDRKAVATLTNNKISAEEFSPWPQCKHANKMAWTVRSVGIVLASLGGLLDVHYNHDRFFKEVVPMVNKYLNIKWAIPTQADWTVEVQTRESIERDRDSYCYRKAAFTLIACLIFYAQSSLWKKCEKKIWEDMCKEEQETKESVPKEEKLKYRFFFTVWPLVTGAGSMLGFKLIVEKFFSGLHVATFDESLYNEIMGPLYIVGVCEYICYVLHLMQSAHVNNELIKSKK